MPIEKGCTHCGSDQHNTTECPMMLAERKSFESWFESEGYESLTLERFAPSPDLYEQDETEALWTGWQARAKQPASVAVPEAAFLRRAISHYEAALQAAFPSGSKGEVFNQWNEARRVAAAPAVQPVECCHEFVPFQAACVKCGEPYAQQAEQKPSQLHVPDECPHMIVFDDADRKPLMFAGTGARQGALRAWEQVSMSWNAHLFVRVARNSRDDRYPSAAVAAPPAAQDVAPLLEALEAIAVDDWECQAYATDSEVSAEKGQLISRIKRTARAALAAHRARQGGE